MGGQAIPSPDAMLTVLSSTVERSGIRYPMGGVQLGHRWRAQRQTNSERPRVTPMLARVARLHSGQSLMLLGATTQIGTGRWVPTRQGGGEAEVLDSPQLAQAFLAGTRPGAEKTHAYASHVYLPGPTLVCGKQALDPDRIKSSVQHQLQMSRRALQLWPHRD